MVLAVEQKAYSIVNILIRPTIRSEAMRVEEAIVYAIAFFLGLVGLVGVFDGRFARRTGRKKFDAPE